LSGAHHGAAVILGEDPFHGDHRWGVLPDHLADAPCDGGQAHLDGRLRRRPHDADVNEGSRTIRCDVDDTDPAAGQARVDAENTQCHAITLGEHPPTRRKARLLSLVVVLFELGLDLGGEVDVAEDVLHVIAVLERVDQTEDLARGVGVDLDLQVRHELNVG